MRLSTDPQRDDARGIAVLHAALDAGITFFDTADAYCLDADETGHNERLIAWALSTWNGDRSRVVVATKGGLTRPEGRWVPDGRARHLAAACEASCRRLGVDRIALYQLHAPDPRTPLATSVRALAALQRDGLVERIGLCNVTVGQIEEARQIAEVDAVQVELSVWHDENLLNGVAAYCIAHRIPLIAYRPLGGPQRRSRTRSAAVLDDLASAHGATTFEIALAWLRDLSPDVLPIPGATRIETVASIARARAVTLSLDDRARLDERFPSGAALRQRDESHARKPPARTDGEVVLIMGLPGAGKSTLAATFVPQGYERLNRDEAGGSLSALLPALDRLVAAGALRIVVDNTYVSRESRARVIRAANQHGLPVRCLWMATSLEDAQVNATWRIVARYGRLLEPDEMRSLAKRDVSAFGPAVPFRYQRELEPPSPDEGFSRIDVVPFVRQFVPTFSSRALIVWCDEVLWRSRSGHRSPQGADDIEVMDERAAVLRRYESDGFRVLGLSWQPEIAAGTRTAAEVDAAVARLKELLRTSIEVEYCPHGGGPPVCWCRKPLPGLGVVLVQRHRLDPAQCIYVGSGTQDPGFARRLGFQYRAASEFFGDRRD